MSNTPNGVKISSAYTYDHTPMLPPVSADGMDANFWRTLDRKLDLLTLASFQGDVKAFADAKKKILIEHIRHHHQDIPKIKGPEHKALRDKLGVHLKDVYDGLSGEDMDDLTTRARGRLLHIKSKLGFKKPDNYLFAQQGLLDQDRQAELIRKGESIVQALEAEITDQSYLGRCFDPVSTVDIANSEKEKFLQEAVKWWAEQHGVDPPPTPVYDSNRTGNYAVTTNQYPPYLVFYPEFFERSRMERALTIEHEFTHVEQIRHRAAFKSSQSRQPAKRNESDALPPKLPESDKYAENVRRQFPPQQPTFHDQIYANESEREAYIRQAATTIAFVKSDVFTPPPKTGLFHDIDLTEPGLDLRIAIGKVIEDKIGATLRQILTRDWLVAAEADDSPELSIKDALEALRRFKTLIDDPQNPLDTTGQLLVSCMPEISRRANDKNDPLYFQFHLIHFLIKSGGDLTPDYFEELHSVYFPSARTDFTEANFPQTARTLQELAENYPDDLTRRLFINAALARAIRNFPDSTEQEVVKKMVHDAIHDADKKHNLKPTITKSLAENLNSLAGMQAQLSPTQAPQLHAQLGDNPNSVLNKLLADIASARTATQARLDKLTAGSPDINEAEQFLKDQTATLSNLQVRVTRATLAERRLQLGGALKRYKTVLTQQQNRFSALDSANQPLVLDAALTGQQEELMRLEDHLTDSKNIGVDLPETPRFALQEQALNELRIALNAQERRLRQRESELLKLERQTLNDVAMNLREQQLRLSVLEPSGDLDATRNALLDREQRVRRLMQDIAPGQPLTEDALNAAREFLAVPNRYAALEQRVDDLVERDLARRLGGVRGRILDMRNAATNLQTALGAITPHPLRQSVLNQLNGDADSHLPWLNKALEILPHLPATAMQETGELPPKTLAADRARRESLNKRLDDISKVLTQRRANIEHMAQVTQGLDEDIASLHARRQRLNALDILPPNDPDRLAAQQSIDAELARLNGYRQLQWTSPQIEPVKAHMDPATRARRNRIQERNLLRVELLDAQSEWTSHIAQLDGYAQQLQRDRPDLMPKVRALRDVLDGLMDLSRQGHVLDQAANAGRVEETRRFVALLRRDVWDALHALDWQGVVESCEAALRQRQLQASLQQELQSVRRSAIQLNALTDGTPNHLTAAEQAIARTLAPQFQSYQTVLEERFLIASRANPPMSGNEIQQAETWLAQQQAHYQSSKAMALVVTTVNVPAPLPVAPPIAPPVVWTRSRNPALVGGEVNNIRAGLLAPYTAPNHIPPPTVMAQGAQIGGQRDPNTGQPIQTVRYLGPGAAPGSMQFAVYDHPVGGAAQQRPTVYELPAELQFRVRQMPPPNVGDITPPIRALGNRFQSVMHKVTKEFNARVFPVQIPSLPTAPFEALENFVKQSVADKQDLKALTKVAQLFVDLNIWPKETLQLLNPLESKQSVVSAPTENVRTNDSQIAAEPNVEWLSAAEILQRPHKSLNPAQTSDWVLSRLSAETQDALTQEIRKHVDKDTPLTAVMFKVNNDNYPIAGHRSILHDPAGELTFILDADNKGKLNLHIADNAQMQQLVADGKDVAIGEKYPANAVLGVKGQSRTAEATREAGVKRETDKKQGRRSSVP